MYFQLPAHLQASLRISDSVPARYARYRMPQAQAALMEFEGGVILSQHLVGKDYGIWQYHCIAEQAITVIPYTLQAQLTISYLLEGRLPVYLHGFGYTTLLPRQSQLFYIPTGGDHRAELPPGLTVMVQLDIDYSLFARAAGGRTNGGQRPPSPVTREISALLEAVTHCDLPEGERSLFLEARVRDLLLHYVGDQARQAALLTLSSREERLLLQVRAYLTDRLDRRLTVEDISSAMGLSAAALQSLVHRATGHGVHHLLTGLRLQTAMELILATDLPIGEIASRVMDSSFSYFSRSFKKYFGFPPAHYRKPGV